MNDTNIFNYVIPAFAFRMYLFIKNFVQFLVLASMSFWLEKI